MLSEQNSTDDNNSFETISLPRAISRPDAPMRIKKKRGIIPDALVQMRLETFRKSFPNFNTKFGIGESSTNERGAHFKGILCQPMGAGDLVRKRIKGESDIGSKWRRD